tara:strand:- start:3260 stop:3679 length:420 start_codon:yes stop_codon:yes gene_type:complete
MIFEILKIIHIVSVVSWMAGLLYLPRIFVYHADKNITKETSNTFKVMEKKLYRYIMTPAAILTWISGLMMIHFFGFELWLITKIVFVLILSIFHIYCGIWLNKFALDSNTHSSRFFRMRNEIPTVLLILIVILVISKPF